MKCLLTGVILRVNVCVTVTETKQGCQRRSEHGFPGGSQSSGLSISPDISVATPGVSCNPIALR